MTKLAKTLYYIRMFLFIIHFYFVFLILHSILDLKIIGYIFLLIYIIYIFKVIIELFSKKRRYKNDFAYNIMQIGVFAYLFVLFINISSKNLYVTKVTYSYFRNNYIFISLLIVFILIYDFVVLKNNNGKKKKI